MAVKSKDELPPVTPPTYATVAAPSGRIQVSASDTDLAKKFLPASQFEVEQKKPEEGMDLMTLYMLMGHKDGIDANPETSDADFAQKFENFVKTFGLENVEVNFDGKSVTLGELSHKISSQYEGTEFPTAGYPMGVLSNARLPVGSPLSARAIAAAEQMAQDKGVLGAIQTASRIVGVDTTYMLLKAKQESGFNPNAHAPKGTAGGLYQFLDNTWFAVTEKHKDLLRTQMHIDVDSLSIEQLRGLKNNAMASALMGAAFAKDNKEYLERHVDVPGFHVNAGALYMAHFLGPAGAEKFFEKLAHDPTASAAELFPKAAAANSSVFAGRSLAELGQWAANKVSGPAPALIPS